MTHDKRQRTRPDAGFTMVEVIVAMMILTIGVLGLAGTTAFVVRQVTGSKIATERSAALQAAIERVVAIGHDSLDVGSTTDTIGSYAISTTVVSSGGTSKLVTFVTTGPGLEVAAGNMSALRASVTDTFTYRMIKP